MGETDRFDLAVFDEVHKTAGRQGTKFSFALDDEKLPIKKRLFMTATPRHYNINKTNKAGDHQLFYSMDDGDKYGNLVHQLSFARSIEQEIICDYRVVISVVTSDEVNDELLSQSDVLVGTDLVLARQVANQIALKRAVEKYQTGKIITFHGQVKSAKSFVSRGNEGVGYHLTDFSYWHINGKMNTSERASIMKEFRNANSSIISNARCLTEGVDVPAVDMVCFMSPKKSKVDIVQAVGRAMRTSDDKEFGYILIPLYLQREIGESIEGALARTDFSEVWNVINALKEQDEVLNDVISQMRTDKGRRKGFDDSRFREKVEILGAEINLETLRRNITVELVDKLSVSWDERYGQLVTYKEEFGDCNVPRGYLENPKLATWIGTQWQNKKNGNLEVEKIEKLNQIGVSWNPYEDSWNQMYQQLIAYKEEFGDCNVLRSYTNPLQLPTWVSEQRTVKKKGKLSEDKIKRLEAIGFSWNPHKDLWKQMYEELVAFKGEFGDCNVPTEYDDNLPLGRWVRKQRQKYEKGKLNPDRVQELEVLGLTWNPDETYWNQMYQELVDYHRVHGDCNVPQKFPENPQLATWVSTRRNSYKTGQLDTDKIQKLDELGFSWNRVEDAWNQMYQELVNYHQAYGDCNVPRYYSENRQLAIWVYGQRQRNNRGNLDAEKIEKLDELGFSWNPDQDFWDKMYDALVEYKEKYGHCNVPQKYSSNPQLATWVSSQRRSMKKDRLSPERIKKLNQLGFDWTPKKATESVETDQEFLQLSLLD